MQSITKVSQLPKCCSNQADISSIVNEKRLFWGVTIFLMFIFLLQSCNNTTIVMPSNNDSVTSTPQDPEDETIVIAEKSNDITIDVAKWFNNKTAAISFTYDIPIDSDPRASEAAQTAIDSMIPLEYEFISSLYLTNNAATDVMKNYWMNQGITFFGHGNYHINHDKLTYDSAYSSFSICYDLMEERGLKPSVYAYPGGAGLEQETQLACKNAGFIAARGTGHYFPGNIEEFYHFSGNKTEPISWYLMKSIPMGKEPESIINNNAQLTPIMNEAINREAYIILCYHHIGFPDGWHYYDLDEFKKDVNSAKKRDFWIATMEDVVLYKKEQNEFTYEVLKLENSDWDYKVYLSDGFDNKQFDQELTLNFNVSKAANGANSVLIENSDKIETIIDIEAGKFLYNGIPQEKYIKLKFLD